MAVRSVWRLQAKSRCAGVCDEQLLQMARIRSSQLLDRCILRSRDAGVGVLAGVGVPRQELPPAGAPVSSRSEP